MWAVMFSISLHRAIMYNCGRIAPAYSHIENAQKIPYSEKVRWKKKAIAAAAK
jgi:predicted Mrr-cat superfamily restriction endonuclease